ncbi:MAG TPA: hypothetical protein VMI54_19950 [Polyangiaceae bacterium]|nr:hypothetical protein [Polyangiaceae bacterium]
MRAKSTNLGTLAAVVVALGGCAERRANDAPARSTPDHGEVATSGSSRVVRVGFTVSNLDRTLAALRTLDFAVEAVGEPATDGLSALYALPGVRARVAEVALGSQRVELTECTTRRGRAIPADSRSNDAWFQHMAIVVRDMDAAYARVFADAHSFHRLSPAPQTIPLSNPAAGGIRALYFRDADNHNLELIWFPSGKGDPVWQAPGTALFLGVDHSAIAVTDPVRSRAAYQTLGFSVAGTSFNFGAEQEALSGVSGARVAITGLRDEAGPGVEFLSYLAPAGGRRAAADSTPCDLWHWEITVAVPSLDAALSALATRGLEARSSAIATFPDASLGYRRAALVEDPDGHALRLVEP